MENITGYCYYCGDLHVGPLIWGIITGPCICVGVPASAWLLVTLIQRHRKGLSNDIYQLNLTIMDMTTNIVMFAYILNYFIWQNAFISRTGDFVLSLSLCGRPFFMTCICVDCYLAVVHPVTYMKTKESRLKVIVSRLLCGLVWGLTIATGMTFTVTPTHMSSPFIVLPLAFTVPAIAVLDVAILYTLRKPDPSGRSDVHPQKRRALQTIINSLVMTLVSYLPSLVIYLFSPLMPLTPMERMCFVLFPSSANTILASTIMPLLFLDNLGKLRGLRTFGCPT